MEKSIKLGSLCWILTGYITSYMLFQFSAYLVSSANPYSPDHLSLLMVFSIVPAIILVQLTKYYLRDSYYREDMAALAVKHPDSRSVLYSLVAGISLGIFIVLGSNILSQYVPSESSTVPEFAEGHRFQVWMVTSVLVAPIVEEMVFRGLVFSFAAPRIGLIYSSFLANFLFVLVHIPNIGMNWKAIFAISMLGFTCQFFRIRTGSLLSAIIAHAAYNLALSFYLLFWE